MSDRRIHLNPRTALQIATTLALVTASAVAAVPAQARTGGASAATRQQERAEQPHLSARARVNACGHAIADSKQCAHVDVTVTQSGSVGLSAAAVMSAYSDSSRVVRVQLDGIALVTAHGTVVGRGAASAPGNRGPARSAATGQVSADPLCRSYGVVVRSSIRLASGELARDARATAWVTPNRSTCPTRSVNGQFTTGSISPAGAAFSLTTSVGVTADHSTIFGDLDFFPPYVSGVSGTQISNVQLLRDGAVVADAAPPLGPVNSVVAGGRTDAGYLVTRGYKPTGQCADYSVRVSYKALFADGRTRSYAVVTPRGQFCVN